MKVQVNNKEVEMTPASTGASGSRYRYRRKQQNDSTFRMGEIRVTGE